MLRRLAIENYGLVERAEITFSDAATILTGETGSGKTMILGALEFALGARASADVVRRNAPRAIVTLTFEPDAPLRETLAHAGFELDADEDAVLVREMSDAGKSSVRLNGRSSTASYAREIADRIADRVGQREALRLLAPAYHLDLLDRYGGAQALRETVSCAYESRAHQRRLLAEAEQSDRNASERYDEARRALEEIDLVAPQLAEDARLNDRRRVLDNVERIATALRNAHDAIAGDDVSASNAFGVARVALDGVAGIGESLREMADAAGVLQGESGELATRIARELDTMESNPAELEAINARLDALDRVKRKYGPMLHDVLARAEGARATVEDFAARDERLAAQRAAVAAAERELEREAAVLRAVRMKAAGKLARAVLAELKELALASARFDVTFSDLESIGASGSEAAEFTFAANAGEPSRPLARVASGGELSRVLLALVVVLASVRERTSLVFDEVDAGVGGATATAVGSRLGRLAQRDQVVCVTHLAQLATWADRHYVLEKRESKAGTTICARELSNEETRATELARMLSGESHAVALEHARTMLRSVATMRA